ncbi:hypothetical protein [Desulfobacter curvatus]|uniref:hypothetical protein n=1 Tax=Desulfobacter curvatus TaxID=2290 RepID=UPI00036EC388|nr:hypothetical protein [Desulfobacter curvatus]
MKKAAFAAKQPKAVHTLIYGIEMKRPNINRLKTYTMKQFEVNRKELAFCQTKYQVQRI